MQRHFDEIIGELISITCPIPKLISVFGGLVIVPLQSNLFICFRISGMCM